LPDGKTFRKIEYFEDDPEALFNRVIAKKGEGIVIKLKNTPYTQGQRVANWLKHKKRSVEELEVIGYTTGRREIAALVTPKGNVNFGVTSETYALWSDRIKDMKKEGNKIMVECEYMELTNAGKMRMPKILNIRDEK
jgi:hypothetical protein